MAFLYSFWINLKAVWTASSGVLVSRGSDRGEGRPSAWCGADPRRGAAPARGPRQPAQEGVARHDRRPGAARGRAQIGRAHV